MKKEDVVKLVVGTLVAATVGGVGGYKAAPESALDVALNRAKIRVDSIVPAHKDIDRCVVIVDEDTTIVYDTTDVLAQRPMIYDNLNVKTCPMIYASDTVAVMRVITRANGDRDIGVISWVVGKDSTKVIVKIDEVRQ